MEDSPSRPDAPRKGVPVLWINYILLVLYVFCLCLPMLGLCGIAALAVGYMARGAYRRQEDPVGEAHASWQINTVWTGVLITVIFMAGAVGFSIATGSNPNEQTFLDLFESHRGAMSGNMDAVLAFIKEAYAVKGLKCLIDFSQILGVLLFFLWSLKRIIQGVAVLLVGGVPEKSALLGMLSFIAAACTEAALCWWAM